MEKSSQHDVLFFPGSFQEALSAPAPVELRLAVLGNYPPNRCGIATFTDDMISAIRRAAPSAVIDVYAMTKHVAQVFDPPVCHAIVADDPESYRSAAARIETSQPDVVWVQHEFGLFGGLAGDLIIETLSRVSAPLVVTLHTILENPDCHQRRVMEWLVARAARLVVMSRQGRSILETEYQVDPERIALIPHGVPDRPFGRGPAMRQRIGLADRKLLLTFGLLSPGKGIEAAIAALPDIVSRHPGAVYCVAGATHPNLLAREGEAYRLRLQDMAKQFGVADHIRWLDRFLETDELLDLIEAADIYLTPYPGAGQSTSGTLSYAVALGKAVVSTPYIHARELLADNHGVLVPFGDAPAISAAVCDLLADPSALAAMQRRAYLLGREMLWSGFAAKTLDVIEAVRVRPAAAARGRRPSPTGLMKLCDDTGIVQHSVLGIADRAHGYCVDDNARALILAGRSPAPFNGHSATFAAFIEHAWNPDVRRFRNFMGYNRCWLEAAGSEDSCGRVLWALGTASAEAEPDIASWADHLYCKAASIAFDFSSPRALAFAALGADRHLDAFPADPLSLRLLEHAKARLGSWLMAARRPGWCWFEPVLAYDNCRLPEALLRASLRLEDAGMSEAALESLRWIAAQQTAPAGHFRPIGSEAFGSTALPLQPFDQQPVDAWATIDAAACAFEATRDPCWLAVARGAFAWFLGANDRAMALADPSTGSCRDGLTRHGVNRNQGAESVLAYHLAQLRISAMEALAGEGHEAIAWEKEPTPV